MPFNFLIALRSMPSTMRTTAILRPCTREWEPIADMRLSERDANYPKSQNTHLHIIEPYTNLYRCLSEFKQALRVTMCLYLVPCCL